MTDGLQIFKEEFLSYVLSMHLEENKTVSFGNMDYDYDLQLKDCNYILFIYHVALDHYGMPYRNTLHYETLVVTNLFGV